MPKFKSLLIALISLAFVTAACDKQESAGADEPEASADEESTQNDPTESDEAAESEETAEGEDLEVVEVAAQGTTFDPPVKTEQIPDGAWMCDMGGNVHYARGEKGDGTCVECGMKLVQKGDGEQAAEDDHAGHNHD